MTEIINTSTDLDIITTALSQKLSRFREGSTKLLQWAIEIGSMLTDIRSLLPHGDFQAHIKSHFEMSIRTAYNYMQFFEGRDIIAQLPSMAEAQRQLKQLDKGKKTEKIEHKPEKIATQKQITSDTMNKLASAAEQDTIEAAGRLAAACDDNGSEIIAAIDALISRVTPGKAIIILERLIEYASDKGAALSESV